MAIADDVKKMQREGKTNQEIMDTLKAQGVSDKDIYSAMSQMQIKNAVSPPSQQQTSQYGQGQQPMQQNYQQTPPQIAQQSEQQYSQQTQQPDFIPQYSQNTPAQNYPPQDQQQIGTGNFAGMEPSLLGQQNQQQVIETPMPPQQETQQYPQDYGQYYQDQYGGYGGEYPAYEGSMSSDTINEIAEQVVTEKLSNLHDKFEKAINFQTTASAKMESLNERLARIEQIIDRLQLSVLQKVGEYINEVGDVKKELHETQKSFSALSNKKPDKENNEDRRRAVP